MRLICAILTLLSLARFQNLTAETLSFNEYGFSLKLPATWKTVDQKPEHVLALVESGDGLKRVVVMAFNFKKSDRGTALDRMIRGAIEEARAQGMEPQNNRDLTLKGVSFRAFDTVNSEGLSILSCMGVAGDTGFSLQGMSTVSDAGSDPEINELISSFELQPKPNNQGRNLTDTESSASKFGRLTANVMGAIFIIGVVVIAIQKGTRKPKRAQQDGPDQPATAPESKSRGKEKPKSESDGRSQ